MKVHATSVLGAQILHLNYLDVSKVVHSCAQGNVVRAAFYAY